MMVHGYGNIQKNREDISIPSIFTRLVTKWVKLRLKQLERIQNRLRLSFIATI